MLWRGRQMYRRLGGAVAAAGLTAPGIGWDGQDPGGADPVTDADLAGLPPSTRRYLRAMGVVGRARDWSFRAHFRGTFRLLGRGGGWMPAEVWQYDVAPQIARVFHMRIDFARMIPMVGSDTYLAGHGLMHGKLLDLITVVRAEGLETDMSELVTYLNDLVLIAPSMLLRLPITFTEVDDDSFDVTLTDAGQTVTARVFLDAEGHPVDFATTDRYADLPSGLVRARWTTPVGGWTHTTAATTGVDASGPRPLPTRGQAIWHLDDTPQPYLTFRLRPGDVRYNVAPDHIASPPL